MFFSRYCCEILPDEKVKKFDKLEVPYAEDSYRFDIIIEVPDQDPRVIEMKRAPVELKEYDPEWPDKFEAERVFLMKIIGQWFYGSIEHVGSTAVPGLLAKPVIDIMFGVKSLNESRPAIDVLVNNGYEYWPYKAEVMHWFCKPSDAFRTHHLHLIPFQSPLWKERIQFRDLLLTNQKITKEYSDLKRELAARYKEDRETYTQMKWPFIQRVLEDEK